MQVKKFEAKTMKEALELVKVHLGPEAIILSAKDTHRGFGLLGEKSVEVTAAVTEETLRKKKLAEAKLREDLRGRFQQIPAIKQRQFINRAYKEAIGVPAHETVGAGAGTEPVSREVRAQTKGMRYIDIADEVPAPMSAVAGHRPVAAARASVYGAAGGAHSDPQPRTRSARVSAAAAAAASAARETFSAPPAQASVAAAVQAPSPMVGGARSSDVEALELQVRELKAIVERFQRVPQIPLSMHPGAEEGLPFELSGLYQRLTGQGMQTQTVSALLRQAIKELDSETLKKPALVDAWAVRRLLDRVEVAANPCAARYHVFTGCSGHGKTTTLVKFASRLMLTEKRTIAVISLDTMKLGAADQLRLYAQILNVPFGIVRSPEEWRVAERRLAGVQHILVDCPGLSLANPGEVAWLRSMLPPADLGRSTHFVQSALGRDEETMEVATRYQQLGFDDVIFTRLDESARQGMILNFQQRFRVPLHSFASGTRIPEDFEFASKERVVDMIFKLRKITKREDQV